MFREAGLRGAAGHRGRHRRGRVRHRPHRPVAGGHGGPRAPRRGALDAGPPARALGGRRRPRATTAAGRSPGCSRSACWPTCRRVTRRWSVHAVGVPGGRAAARAPGGRARAGRARGPRGAGRAGERRGPRAVAARRARASWCSAPGSPSRVPTGWTRQRALLRTAHAAGMRVVGPSSYGIVATRDGGCSSTPRCAHAPGAAGASACSASPRRWRSRCWRAVRRRGIGAVAVRLRRAPRRRLRQRPHAVLGRRRRHGRGRPVPGVAGQPPQVLPGRAAAVADQARDRGDRGPVGPGGAARPRGPPHARPAPHARGGAAPVRACPRREHAPAARRRPGAGPPAAARRAAHRDPGQLRARSRRWSPRPPPPPAWWSAGTCSCCRRTPRPSGSARPSTRSTPTRTATWSSSCASRPSVGRTACCSGPSPRRPRARGGRPWPASTTCTASPPELTADDAERPTLDGPRVQHARGRGARAGARHPLRRSGARGTAGVRCTRPAPTPGPRAASSPAGSPPRAPATRPSRSTATGPRSCWPPWASRCCPRIRVRDADEAVAAAERLGWPVALKTTVAALRHRADLGGVRLDVADEAELRADVAQVLALAAGQESAGRRRAAGGAGDGPARVGLRGAVGGGPALRPDHQLRARR